MHVQAPTGVEPPQKPRFMQITGTVVVQFTIMAILLVKQPKNIAHPS